MRRKRKRMAIMIPIDWQTHGVISILRSEKKKAASLVVNERWVIGVGLAANNMLFANCRHE